ncbi:MULTISPECIES: outer membrane lipoprotein chaperone LolA [Oligella]|uniref:outer membrane lipoprotein chaperone LolA n=1 Tax=Oligella TaxID=90243 RepID=UPI00069FCB4B|nr:MULTISPECIES: outer membrane lipoprotein chaperone LolA [Oligella]OFV49445.1 outer membrane lipoprotein carrier protein LolA [Oligella sp. HMSC09E12]
MNKLQKLSLSLTVFLALGSGTAMAQFTVNPDTFQEGAGQAVDLGEIQFTKIPDVKNTTQTDAKQQLRDFVKNIKSATGQFAQQGGGSNAQKTQSGTFSFERPGKFVWHVSKPYEQKVISDGQRVYQYDPDLAQVTVRNIKDSVGASPASILFGNSNLDDNFSVEVLPERDGMVWLRATPKVADQGMAFMDIAFANNLPAELRIRDSFGQTTTIKLRNFKANARIPASEFTFKAPAGVDVVNM